MHIICETTHWQDVQKLYVLDYSVALFISRFKYRRTDEQNVEFQICVNEWHTWIYAPENRFIVCSISCLPNFTGANKNKLVNKPIKKPD